MKQSIYHYRSASRYLLDQVVIRQKLDRGFSIRKWAKEMGFPSHSLLSMIIQGKRSMNLRQVPYLAKGLALTTPEKLFFQGLIQIENARTPEEKAWCELWLSELRPEAFENDGKENDVREIDEYITLSDWRHPAVLALADTHLSFRDASGVPRELTSSENVAEIRSIIERLVALKLLVKSSNGVYRTTCGRMTTKDDVANRGAREYHRQAALLASSRIGENDQQEREFQSLAIAVPESRIPLAKEMIRKFRTQFSAAMSSAHADQVYQFNLHFFRLTESPSKPKVSKENEGADHHQSA